MSEAAASLRQWVGRRQVTDDVVAPIPCAAMAAMLDGEPARPAHGAPLPPLWHWLYCLPLIRQSDLGPDGHAVRGGLLPPSPLPRRMWAGGRFEFGSPLRVGDPITRTSVIESTLLLDLLRRERPQPRVTRFRFRAMRPLFDPRPFTVCGMPAQAGASARLCARDPDGHLAMDAEAHLE